MTVASEDIGSASAIYERYRGLISSGILGVGERLPTVRQTATDLDVAIGTAARAYKQLEQDGLVVTRTAAGTRVAPGAAPLPGTVVAHIRELVILASHHHVNQNDVLAAVRTLWPQ